MTIGPTMSRVLAQFLRRGHWGPWLDTGWLPVAGIQKMASFYLFYLASLENTSTHNSRTDAKNTRHVFLGAVGRALDCGPVEGLKIDSFFCSGRTVRAKT